MSVSASAPELLIVTDVFGNTPAIANFARQFSLTSLIASPLSDAHSQFATEKLAYHAFIAGGGIAFYSKQLASLLERHQTSLRYAIGFSAGASALWINSATPAMAGLQASVLFYGSRIREHRDIQPNSPVRLIFSEQEAAFEPAELVSDLRQRGHAAEIVKNTRHGFMNPYSSGYCLKTQERFVNELVTQMQGHTRQAA
ncbi:dienelactone hydrolase family protein [Undibacterium sp. TJN19]|uniref:dienelactone hydrolase family protein n=1 Tax=Undibacterium sp. TJN19 TaxID=3413055 RepID=UPI003BF318F5